MSINVQHNATPFSDLQAMVLEVFKRTDKTTELKRALNETYREMCAAVEPRKLQDQIYQTCIVRQEDYAVPDQILRVNHPIRLLEPTALTNTSGQGDSLRFISKDEYDFYEPNPNAAIVNPGRPYAYTLFKNSLLLTPIPDRPYLIEVNVGGEPVVMVEDSDATIFSPQWDEVLKNGALSRLYLGLQLKDEASSWMQIYRYGFAGDKDNILGGLGLIKKINDDTGLPPKIVQYRDF